MQSSILLKIYKKNDFYLNFINLKISNKTYYCHSLTKMEYTYFNFYYIKQNKYKTI